MDIIFGVISDESDPASRKYFSNIGKIFYSYNWNLGKILFSNLVPINCCTKICWLTILFSIYFTYIGKLKFVPLLKCWRMLFVSYLFENWIFRILQVLLLENYETKKNYSSLSLFFDTCLTWKSSIIWVWTKEVRTKF